MNINNNPLAGVFPAAVPPATGAKLLSIGIHLKSGVDFERFEALYLRPYLDAQTLMYPTLKVFSNSPSMSDIRDCLSADRAVDEGENRFPLDVVVLPYHPTFNTAHHFNFNFVVSMGSKYLMIETVTCPWNSEAYDITGEPMILPVVPDTRQATYIPTDILVQVHAPLHGGGTQIALLIQSLLQRELAMDVHFRGDELTDIAEEDYAKQVERFREHPGELRAIFESRSMYGPDRKLFVEKTLVPKELTRPYMRGAAQR